MNLTDQTQLATLLAETALQGGSEAEQFNLFCSRLVAGGIPLTRAMFGLDTLHPVLSGRIYEWNRGQPEVKKSEYGRGESSGDTSRWTNSPFYFLEKSGEKLVRSRVAPGPDGTYRFPILEDLAKRGITDYVAVLTRFGASTVIGDVDSIYSSWATDDPAGFSDAHVATLEALIPSLLIGVRAVSMNAIAKTLVETYLGRGAGKRVLRGNITRGDAEHLNSVLWMSDLKGFTRIVDSVDPALIMPLLNDYADAVVSAIHAHDGQVLKFIGDGVLATFRADDPAKGTAQALDAAQEAFARASEINVRRTAAKLPVSEPYVALHIGEVFYGNFGAVDRLDFTVVGPAVNELSRISGMSRSLDQDVIISSAFADAAVDRRDWLVSLGRYALRGVSRPQELFTLDRTRVLAGTRAPALVAAKA
jgi:adenylate cyclase